MIKKTYDIDDYNSIDELKLWSWIYSSNLKIGDKVLNLLRNDSSLGSAVLFRTNKGKIALRDFATDETYKPLDYYMRLTGKTFYKALQDLCSNNIQHIYVPTATLKQAEETTISFVKRKFTKLDAEYWTSYGINSQQLKEDNVVAISSYCINNTEYYKAYDHSYALQLNGRVKIYQPFAPKEVKWKSTTKSTDYWKFTTNSKIGILTSSYKGGRVLFNLYNVNVYAPQNERKTLPNNLLEELDKLEHVYIMYDGDKTGVENSIHLGAKYGYTHVEFPVDCEIVNSYNKKVNDYPELYRYDRKLCYNLL